MLLMFRNHNLIQHNQSQMPSEQSQSNQYLCPQGHGMVGLKKNPALYFIKQCEYIFLNNHPSFPFTNALLLLTISPNYYFPVKRQVRYRNLLIKKSGAPTNKIQIYCQVIWFNFLGRIMWRSIKKGHKLLKHLITQSCVFGLKFQGSKTKCPARKNWKLSPSQSINRKGNTHT